MRYLHVTVPSEKYLTVKSILQERDIDFSETSETGEGSYEAVVSFPLPTEAVEPLLDEFRSIGLDEQSHIVIQNAEAILSTSFGDLQREYDEFSPDERIAHEEIRVAAKNLISDTYTFVLLSIASSIVATAGLLLDSASIVVGSMVIAPLIGPAMATGVGTALYDQALFWKGTKFQVFGFGLAILSATAFAFLVRVFFLVPPNVEITALEQIAGRLSPDLLTLVVALGAGAAGARSLEADVSTPLIGVMMAAALIPPTAAVGIGIAWGLPNVVLRSGLLVLVNTFSINLCALAVLWYSGVRSSKRTVRDAARRVTRKRLLVLLIGTLLLAGVLGMFTWSAYQSGASSQAIRNDIDTVLDDPAYGNLSVVEVRIEQQERTLTNRPERVIVTVTRPAGMRYPRLDNRIDQRIDQRSGRDVEIQVRFIDVEASD